MLKPKKFSMGIKPGPKRIAKSTGMPDRRQRDNKLTPGNIPTLKPHIHKKGGLTPIKTDAHLEHPWGKLKSPLL